MNRYERPDRNIRQKKEGLWKRTPQHWTQDHYHLGHTDSSAHSRNDLYRSCNYVDPPSVGHIEGYGVPSLYPPLRGLPANTVMLDEMTLRHMVQDCTAVKTQLLKMKRILHQNDENVSLHNIPLSLPSSPEFQESAPVFKNEDLLNEITQLKEVLKKKDETIKSLEQQLSVRCNCNKGSKKSEVAACSFAEKYTQTSWRKNAPQVLQPSSLLPRFTDITQGKLIKTSPIVDHNEHPSQDQHTNDGHEYQNDAGGFSANNLNELSTLSTKLVERKSEKNKHSTKIVNITEKSKDLIGRKCKTLLSHSSSSQSHLSMQETPTKLFLKNRCSWTNQAPPPKTSRAAKSLKQNVLVPPPVSVAATVAAPNGSSALKAPEMLPPSNPALLQSASSHSDLNGKSQRTSKLRPPAISSRPKQTTNPKVIIPPDHQNACSPTNHSRQQLTQTKGNMQNQDLSVHSGDSIPPNRHSRLPKPKTY